MQQKQILILTWLQQKRGQRFQNQQVDRDRFSAVLAGDILLEEAARHDRLAEAEVRPAPRPPHTLPRKTQSLIPAGASLTNRPPPSASAQFSVNVPPTAAE